MCRGEGEREGEGDVKIGVIWLPKSGSREVGREGHEEDWHYSSITLAQHTTLACRSV